MGGAHEHGLVAKPHALVVGVEDPVDDGAGLAGGVVAANEHRAAAAGPFGSAARGGRPASAGRTRLARVKIGCTERKLRSRAMTVAPGSEPARSCR